MKTSALKTLTAIAITTAACVSFAQQPSDANAAGGTTAPYTTDVNPATGVPRSAAPATVDTPTYSTTTVYQGTAANPHGCSGLSDRETERACRQGYPTQHANMPAPTSGDQGGQTDDQAD